MKLEEWLQLTGISQEKFGKMIGRSQKTVYNWVNNLREPSVGDALKIHEITNKRVSFKELVKEKRS